MLKVLQMTDLVNKTTANNARLFQWVQVSTMSFMFFVSEQEYF